MGSQLHHCILRAISFVVRMASFGLIDTALGKRQLQDPLLAVGQALLHLGTVVMSPEGWEFRHCHPGCEARSQMPSRKPQSTCPVRLGEGPEFSTFSESWNRVRPLHSQDGIMKLFTVLPADREMGFLPWMGMFHPCPFSSQDSTVALLRFSGYLKQYAADSRIIFFLDNWFLWTLLPQFAPNSILLPISYLHPQTRGRVLWGWLWERRDSGYIGRLQTSPFPEGASESVLVTSLRRLNTSCHLDAGKRVRLCMCMCFPFLKGPTLTLV